MKIKELIQRIQSTYSKGVPSDDSRLTNRHIYNKLLTTRALLLSREVNKKRKLSAWNYSTLPCVEIVEITSNEECPCIPDVGCSVYRSKYKLPKPIVSLSSYMIKGVYSTDAQRSIKFTEVSVNQSKYTKGGKYSSNNNKYMLHNGYIYIISKVAPIAVSIDLLVEDIMEAYNFVNYCNNNSVDCADKILEKEFPIDGYLLEPLIQITIDELISGFSKSLQDSLNNSQDNAINNFKSQGDLTNNSKDE